MHETNDDIRALQRLLDRSYETAGAHLKSIFTEELRIPAERLAGQLQGVQILNLATVTASGEPRVAPVDSVFFRGRFWFGSSHDSQRFRHIRARPAVSATVTRGERFAVIVHGRAQEVDTADPALSPFVDCLEECYGGGWREWAGDSPYAQIVPQRMYTYGLPIS